MGHVCLYSYLPLTHYSFFPGGLALSGLPARGDGGRAGTRVLLSGDTPSYIAAENVFSPCSGRSDWLDVHSLPMSAIGRTVLHAFLLKRFKKCFAGFFNVLHPFSMMFQYFSMLLQCFLSLFDVFCMPFDVCSMFSIFSMLFKCSNAFSMLSK